MPPELTLDRALAAIDRLIEVGHQSDVAASLTHEEQDRLDELARLCQSGTTQSRRAMTNYLAEMFTRRRLHVAEHTPETLAEAVYARRYGMGELQPWDDDLHVSEIRVDPRHLSVIQNGRLHTTPSPLDEDGLMLLIQRLTTGRGGINARRSNVEAAWGSSRIHALIPPNSTAPTLIVRKHAQAIHTPEHLIASGEMEPRAVALLRLVVRARCNTFLTGRAGAGKTTLLRTLLGFYEPTVHRVTIEDRQELAGRYHYRQHLITELLTSPEMSADDLLAAALGLSPDVLAVGEVRRGRDALVALMAGDRGHPGGAVTFHANSARHAYDAFANLLLETGLPLTPDQWRHRVSQWAQASVHIWADPPSGLRRVEEILVTDLEEGSVRRSVLCRWVPDPDDYSRGQWEYPEAPPAWLLDRLHRYGGPGALKWWRETWDALPTS